MRRGPFVPALRRVGVCLPSILFLVIAMACPAAAAGNNRPAAGTGAATAVSGVVESVGASSLKVSGNSYDISQAVIMNSSRRSVRPADIEIGSKIELYIKNGKVVTVIVHPKYMFE